MTITAEMIYSYVSPFIAAGMASWLTYALAIRQKRHEVLIGERLAAFKAVQARLVALKHYCEATAGEYSGGDLQPRVDDLPEGEPRSALTQATELQRVVDQHRIFFSAAARKDLDGLSQQVCLLASMELAVTSDPSLGDPGVYGSASEQVDRCIERLYKELRFPA
jgi:hypothetical protein